MPFKRDLTPLTPGGSIAIHQGKGSQMATMPSRSLINGLATPGTNSINDYSKATPMAKPTQDGPQTQPSRPPGS